MYNNKGDLPFSNTYLTPLSHGPKHVNNMQINRDQYKPYQSVKAGHTHHQQHYMLITIIYSQGLHVLSSPDMKGHLSFSHLLASVVRKL